MSTRDARLIPKPGEAFEVEQWTLLWALSLVAIATFGVLVTVHAGSARGSTALEDVSETLAAVIAAVACASRAKRDHRDGPVEAGVEALPWRAWRLLAFGMGAWALGHSIRGVYEVGFGVTPESPSFMDAVLLTSSVLVAGGLLSMVRTPAGRLSHLRGAVEGLLIAAGCFLISWCALIAGVFASSHAATSAQVVNLAYPALDAVALSAVLFVAMRGKEHLPAGLGLLALGIAYLAISDSAFWYVNALEPSFSAVSPIDVGWVAGFLAITVAAAQRDRPRQWTWTRKLAGGPLVRGLPTLPAAVGVITALVSWWVGRSLGDPGVLLSIGAVVVLLALLLQLIAVYENHALTADLERRVEQRTASSGRPSATTALSFSTPRTS